LGDAKLPVLKEGQRGCQKDKKLNPKVAKGCLRVFLKIIMKKKEILHRVVTFLSRKELDYLDNISKDILFSEGIKISRSLLLKEIIDIFLLSKKSPRNYEELIKNITEYSRKGGQNG